jgi:general secretion pathway protein C
MWKEIFFYLSQKTKGKRFWQTFFLFLMGYLLGKTSMNLYEKHLWKRIPPPPPPQLLAQKEKEDFSLPFTAYTPLVEKNPFQVDLRPPSSEEGTTQPIQQLPPLQYELVGTIAGPELFSVAFLRHKETQKIEGFRIGDPVGGGILVEVLRGSVKILRGGNIEELSLAETPLLTSTAEPINPTPLPPTPSLFTPEPPEPDLDVRQEGDRFILDRRQFQSVVSDFGPLLTQARVIPYFQEGKIIGYKIFAIKEGSIYEKIGLREGDILFSINGLRVDSPEKALQLFQQLRSENRFQIEIERNGQRMTLNYVLR